MIKRKKRSVFHVINLHHNWWVFLFVFSALLTYIVAIKHRNLEIDLQKQKLQSLELAQKETIEKNDDLALKIASQKDPAWIELVLMKKLGVVPKGKQKVHFTNK